jgi:cellulose synthase (UDP-forming)
MVPERNEREEAPDVKAAFLVAVGVAILLTGIVVSLDSKKSRDRKRAAALWSAAGINYLAWRVCTSFQWSAQGWLFWQQMVFLFCEGALIYATWRAIWLLSITIDRSAEADEHTKWWVKAGEASPTVAILIPTFNEPLEVVERAVAGAILQDFPASVWLLDDGNRKDMRSLAVRAGVGYLARPSHEGAKAGNLNYCLEHLAGLRQLPAFIAVVDSDFVATRTFLDRLISLMHDPRVSLVQAPQDFYNRDHFQTILSVFPLPPIGDFIYHVRLASQDAWDLGMCHGTSFLLRTSALAEIGGFPVASVGENLLTTILLRKRGWKIVYLNEILSSGFATAGLREHWVQRQRWALGVTEIAIIALRDPTIPFVNRLFTAEAWFRSIYASLLSVFLVVVPPLAFWVFGWRVALGEVSYAAASAIPLLVAAWVYMWWLGPSRTFPMHRTVVNCVTGLPYLIGIARGLAKWGDSARFDVTPKSDVVPEGGFVLPITITSISALLGLLIAMAHSLGRPRTASDPMADIMVVWGIYTIAVLGLTAYASWDRRRQANVFRYPIIRESVTVTCAAETFRTNIAMLSERILVPGDTLSGLKNRGTCAVSIQDIGEVAGVVFNSDPTTGPAVALQPTDKQRFGLIQKLYSKGFRAC